MNIRKPTNAPNPKEGVGQTKAPIGLAPFTAIIEMAFAFMEGALKYGRFNWRIAGVRASTYYDAIQRHMGKWYNGRNRDPKTRIHELASVMACCAILIDAEKCGKLNDDRPPRAPVGDILDGEETLALIAHLKELFKEHNPKQFTIADEPTEANQIEANGGGGKPPCNHHFNLSEGRACTKCGYNPMPKGPCRPDGSPYVDIPAPREFDPSN